jgi:hypothetical protein
MNHERLMKSMPIESFYVIVHTDANTDGEGIEVPVMMAEVADRGEEIKFLPVFVSREHAEGSDFMAEMVPNLSEDRSPGTYGMLAWQLEGYLRDNPNIDAVLLVYPKREFTLWRADFFKFLELVGSGPDVEDVSGLSA